MKEELEKIMEIADELEAKAVNKLEKQEQNFIHPVLAKNFAEKTKFNANSIIQRMKNEDQMFNKGDDRDE